MIQWIIDTLMMVSALTVLVLILRRPVATLFGPAVTYWLWLLPAARIFMPPLQGAAIKAPSELQYQLYQTVVDIPTQVTAASIDWTALTIVSWLSIAALIFILQMLRYIEMRDCMLTDSNDLGQIDGVRLIQSDQVSGPLAFGLFRRFIVVPQNFSQIFAADEREMALAHEMAHHKSGDLFANLAAFVVLCLTWFNPLSWLAWSAFRFDQEAACDARVLRGKDAKARETYGRTLARAAYEGAPTFAMALNSPKTTISRMRKLTMKDISTYRRRLGKIGVIATTALALLITATVVPVTAQDKVADGSELQIRTIVVKKGEDIPYVTNVTKGDKVIVIKTDEKLSDAEVQKIIEEADNAVVNPHADKSNDVVAIKRADEKKKIVLISKHILNSKKADGKNVSYITVRKENGEDSNVTRSSNFDTIMIPEINVSEIENMEGCRKGEPITTDVSGAKNWERARIKLVMCGRGSAKMGRVSAVTGMKQALSEIRQNKDISDDIRKQITDELETQIKKIEQGNAAEK